MSDRVSKAGLSTGSSWSLFAENIAFEESGKFFYFTEHFSGSIQNNFQSSVVGSSILKLILVSRENI